MLPSHDNAADLSRRLELLTAEFEAAQQDAHRLARTVSHNLSTPLTSTRWLLETFLERNATSVSADDAKLFDRALKNLDEMVGMLESLVSHTKVGLKTMHATTATSTRKALDQAIAKLQSEVKASGAELAVADLPAAPVETDALVCLFENLLSNALKFRRAGAPPRISIGASREGDHWILSVADEGVGIAPHDSRRIFEPFQRLNPSIPGRGIGLATCRKIVERTGGRIWVDSKPGEGAVFRFSLPASIPPSDGF